MRTLETIPTGPHEAEIVSTAAIQETYPKDYEAMLAAGSALAQESRGRQYLLRMKSLSDFGKIKAIIPPDVAGARLLMNTEALQQLHGSAKNIATGIRKALQAALENKNIPEGEKTIGVLGLMNKARWQARYAILSGLGVVASSGLTIYFFAKDIDAMQPPAADPESIRVYLLSAIASLFFWDGR